MICWIAVCREVIAAAVYLAERSRPALPVSIKWSCSTLIVRPRSAVQTTTPGVTRLHLSRKIRRPPAGLPSLRERSRGGRGGGGWNRKGRGVFCCLHRDLTEARRWSGGWGEVSTCKMNVAHWQHPLENPVNRARRKRDTDLSRRRDENKKGGLPCGRNMSLMKDQRGEKRKK